MTEPNMAAGDLTLRLLARRTAAVRLQTCSRMFSTAKVLVLAGLLAEGGQQTSTETRRRLFLRLYGNEFTWSQREAIPCRRLRAAMRYACTLRSVMHPRWSNNTLS